MIQSRVNIAVVVLVGATCAVSGAQAADERGHLPEAVHRIERETGGKVLSAARSSHNGREATRIKVYTPEGRVRVMWDQPQRERPLQPEPAPRPQMVRPEPSRQQTPMPTSSAGRTTGPRNLPQQPALTQHDRR